MGRATEVAVEKTAFRELLRSDWIGFDMDHALIRYHLPNLFEIMFSFISKELIEVYGFPAKLRDLDRESIFAAKGLILDIEKGNILKIDSTRRVTSAFHGFTRLPPLEIETFYGSGLSEFFGVATERFKPLTTFFETAIGPLFAAMVTVLDDGEVGEIEVEKGSLPRKPTYKDLASLITAAMNANLNDFHSGNYYPIIKKNVGAYIRKDEGTKEWLTELREQGRKLFLMTNSGWDYTKLLMEHAFGDNWHTYFDVVVIRAKKPSFFHADDGTVPLEKRSHIEGFHRLYEGGRLAQLLTVFRDIEDRAKTLPTNDDEGARKRRKVEEEEEDDDTASPQLNEEPEEGGFAHLGVHPESLHPLPLPSISSSPSVCYFGDHCIGDVYYPRRAAGWSTIAVIEEVEEGFAKTHPTKDGKMRPLPSYVTSPEWGSYLVSSKGVPTFWAQLISENAVFCLPSVAAAARLKKLEALDRAPCLFFPLPPSPTDIEDEEDIIHRAYPLERFVRLSV